MNHLNGLPVKLCLTVRAIGVQLFNNGHSVRNLSICFHRKHHRNWFPISIYYAFEASTSTMINDHNDVDSKVQVLDSNTCNRRHQFWIYVAESSVDAHSRLCHRKKNIYSFISLWYNDDDYSLSWLDIVRSILWVCCDLWNRAREQDINIPKLNRCADFTKNKNNKEKKQGSDKKHNPDSAQRGSSFSLGWGDKKNVNRKKRKINNKKQQTEKWETWNIGKITRSLQRWDCSFVIRFFFNMPTACRYRRASHL